MPYEGPIETAETLAGFLVLLSRTVKQGRSAALFTVSLDTGAWLRWPWHPRQKFNSESPGRHQQSNLGSSVGWHGHHVLNSCSHTALSISVSFTEASWSHPLCLQMYLEFCMLVFNFPAGWALAFSTSCVTPGTAPPRPPPGPLDAWSHHAGEPCLEAPSYPWFSWGCW